MPITRHSEKHFTASETVRDIVIGMSDGLTVPFALAAGLSGAAASTHIVVTAGLAEIAAGSIAMGLGGYLAAKTDFEHYTSERKREFREIDTVPGQEAQEVSEIFQNFGLSRDQVEPLVNAIRNSPTQWVDFMMRFELGLEPPNPKRARQSAFTIAFAYIVGGLVPLMPYILLPTASLALQVSVVLTLLALFLFGYIKGRFTGLRPLMSGFQTLLIGGLSATAAFLLAQLFK